MRAYDVIIAGGGLSGLMVGYFLRQLAPDMQLCIIEARPHYEADRHWGFWWPNGQAHPFSDAVIQRYPAWHIKTRQGRVLSCRAEKYHYELLDSGKWYQLVEQHLGASIVYEERCDAVTAQTIRTNKNRYTAPIVLDARPPEVSDVPLVQQFRGYIVETAEAYFDRHNMTLMDFSIRQPASGFGFLYLLPLSSRRALVEPTAYTPSALDSHWFEQQLHQVMVNTDYRCVAEEQGCLPLGLSKPALDAHAAYPVGTRGGWMRPSTGYAFYQTMKMARQLARVIVTNCSLPGRRESRSYSRQAEYLDRIALRVMRDHPTVMPDIFSRWFSALSPDEMVRFLQDNASGKTRLRLIAQTPWKRHFLESLCTR